MRIYCQCGADMQPIAIDINEYDPEDITIVGECPDCYTNVVDQAGYPLSWSPPYYVARIYQAA